MFQEERTQFSRFIRQHMCVVWSAVLAVFVSYGAALCGLRVGIDSEVNINDPDALFLSWYQLGRYTLVFLKDMLGMRSFDPALENFLMMGTLILCGILASYFFWRLSGGADGAGMRLFYVLFPALLLTHPCYVQQFVFTLQAFEVAFCMALVLLAAYCACRWAETGSWFAFFFGVLCMVFGFGGYQALVPFYMTAALSFYMVYYRFHDGQKKWFYLKMAVRHLVIFAVGYVLYNLLGKCILAVGFGISLKDGQGYLTNQIAWTEYPASVCIMNIKRYVRDVLLGEYVYFPRTFLWFALIYAGRLLYVWWKERRREYVFYAAAALFLAVSPFFLCFYQGSMPLMRGQLSLPFAAAFFGASILTFLPGRQGRKMETAASEEALKTAQEQEVPFFGSRKGIGHGEWSRGIHGIWNGVYAILAVFLFLCAANQGSVSSRAMLLAQRVYETDCRMADQIVAEMRRLGASDSGQRIAMIGQYTPGIPDSMKDVRHESVGYSFFEWDFMGPAGVSRRGAGFMRAVGLPYEAASEEEYLAAKEFAASMPCWPSAGSVERMGDVVIVKFSE